MPAFTRNKLIGLATAALVLVAGTPSMNMSEQAEASQYRKFNRIRVPVDKKKPEAKPDGFTQVARPIPLPRRLSERFIKDVVRAWNTQKLNTYLAGNFNDRQRLLDTIREDVPRDARLRVTGVQGVDVLLQRVKGEGRGYYKVKSVAAARVRLRIEFQDPAAGFTVINTSGEYIFDVALRVKRVKRQP
ncbi:MAG: hypothetical protein AAF441_09175 [Pseudomonadota bacterium]